MLKITNGDIVSSLHARYSVIEIQTIIIIKKYVLEIIMKGLCDKYNIIIIGKRLFFQFNNIQVASISCFRI